MTLKISDGEGLIIYNALQEFLNYGEFDEDDTIAIKAVTEKVLQCFIEEA